MGASLELAEWGVAIPLSDNPNGYRIEKQSIDSGDFYHVVQDSARGCNVHHPSDVPVIGSIYRVAKGVDTSGYPGKNAEVIVGEYIYVYDGGTAGACDTYSIEDNLKLRDDFAAVFKNLK